MVERSSRRPQARWTVVLILAVSIGGCVVDASGEEAVSTTYPAPPDAVPAELAELAQLVPDPPVGFLREPDEVAGTGPIDLEAAALGEGRADSETFLRDAGYLRGLRRRYVDSLRARRIDVWVYEFGEPAGAEGQMLRDQEATPSDAMRLDIADVAGASAWRRDRPEESTVRVAFAAGPLFVRVETIEPAADTATAHVLAVTATVYSFVDALGASSTTVPE